MHFVFELAPEFPHPAASLFTTAEDYAKFMRACVKDEFVSKYMFEPQLALSDKDSKAKSAGVSPEALDQINWGLGMGLQRAEDGSIIAFHWGDVNTCRSFAAINLETGDAAVCLTNSANGPTVFRELIEPAVGNIDAVSAWLGPREKLEFGEQQTVHQMPNPP